MVGSFKVDPDSLDAAGKVARRQYVHVENVQRYVSSNCSNVGAFSGVMDLFQGTYESALRSVSEGLNAGLRIATKTENSYTKTAGDYRDADRDAYDRAKRIAMRQHGPGYEFPAYAPPGSGDTNPGGPSEAPLKPPKEDEDFKLEIPKGTGDDLLKMAGAGPGLRYGYKNVVEAVTGTGGGFLPDATDRHAPPDDTETHPPQQWVEDKWTDPKGWLGDAGKDTALSMRHRQEYLDLRQDGKTHDEAMKSLKDTHSVDSYMDAHDRNEMRDRRGDAYDAAYARERSDSIAEGRSEHHAEARAQEAGREASAQTREDVTNEHKARDRAAGGIADLNALKAGVNNAVDNVNKAATHGANIVDNVQDAGRYSDYEDKTHDDSVDDWARDTSGESWADQ